jgi:hypothetical protein
MSEFKKWFANEVLLFYKNSIFLIINDFSQLSLFFSLSNKIFFFKIKVPFKNYITNFKKKTVFFPKNFNKKFFPKFQIFFSFQKSNLNLMVLFKILKKVDVKILFFFLKKKISNMIFSKLDAFFYKRIVIYINFLTKPFLCKNFLKKNFNFNNSNLIKFFIRNKTPKILILKWDSFFRTCFIKKNNVWGKFVKNIKFSLKIFKNILNKNLITGNSIFFEKIEDDLLQRTLDEIGIISSRVNFIGIDEILFLLNNFI